MKVKDLKAILKGAPDDALIVTSGMDHSYDNCHATITTAITDPFNNMSEDYGEADTPLDEGEKRINVVVIN